MLRAMILAAGRGNRMRPLTDHTPKPLLTIGGKPLIVWHIEKLAACGIREIIINHAHLGHQIEAYLGDGSQFDVHILYSAETQGLETAGGIRHALPLLDPDHSNHPFAVINGDIFCDFDYSQLSPLANALQDSNQYLAHLLLVSNPSHNPDGDFGLKQQAVCETPADYTFSGIGLYKAALFTDIADGQVAPLGPLLRHHIRQQQISGNLFSGAWTDVGTPERLLQLNQQLQEH